MVRLIALALTALATTLAWPGARPAAQVVAVPARDPGAVPARGTGAPSVRHIPIGTAAIVGTVVTSDTGRPVRGVRVSVNGTITSPGRPGGAAPGGAPGVFVSAGLESAKVPGAVQVTGSMVASGVSRSVLTDEQGRFAFDKLPAGRFSLSAMRPPYLNTNYGQKRPGGQGTAIVIGEGDRLEVTLPVHRGAIISGMVLNELGEPQAFAQVRAWRFMLVNGVRRLQGANGGSTDDRGMYRLFNLQPGEYIIGATPTTFDMTSTMSAETLIEQAIATATPNPPASPGLPATVTVTIPAPVAGTPEGPPGYLPTYYAGAASPGGATVIRLAGDEERSSVDIIAMPVRASTVTGSVVAALEQGVAVRVSLIPEDVTMAEVNSTQSNANGQFTFRNVAPGRYTLLAQTVPGPRPAPVVGGVTMPPPPQPAPRLEESQQLWGAVDVVVSDQPVVPVTVALQRGRAISGVVLFEVERPPDLSRARLTVSLSNAPGSPVPMFGPAPQAQIEPDGRFRLGGVIPGRYTLRAGGGNMKSALVGGVDTLDFPLDFTGERDIGDAILTVTDKFSEVAGTLTDAQGRPASDYTIVAAPSDSRYWTPGSRRILYTRPDTAGRYTIRGLPPGSYLLAAVDDLEPGAQYDPDFLRMIGTGAVTVLVTESGTARQDLRLRR